MDNDLVYTEMERTETLPLAASDEPADDTRSLARTVLSPGAVLFPAKDLDDFRARWREIQTGFVDEPRRSVEQANALVGLVIQHLTDVFSNERAKLENEWQQGKDVSTEDLRQALRRYHSFFDRLLAV
jgi:hypothetical protein